MASSKVKSRLLIVAATYEYKQDSIEEHTLPCVMSTPLTFCKNCTVVLQDPVSFVKYINDAQIFISTHVNYFSFMSFCIGWVKNFDEIALSCTVKKIEANFCFSTFGKNSKWPPFLGRGTFFRYPMGRKIENHSILHG